VTRIHPPFAVATALTAMLVTKIRLNMEADLWNPISWQSKPAQVLMVRSLIGGLIGFFIGWIGWRIGPVLPSEAIAAGGG
jgi:hypothetical protein